MAKRVVVSRAVAAGRRTCVGGELRCAEHGALSSAECASCDAEVENKAGDHLGRRVRVLDGGKVLVRGRRGLMFLAAEDVRVRS